MTHSSTGAWFRGRIHDDGCDLSPDGKLFVYFATQYDRTPADGYGVAWTAVSKPPWLTALAMWPRDDSWGGRAYFADNTTVVIDCPHWERLIAHENHLPRGLNVVTRWIGRDAPEQKFPEMPHKSAHFGKAEGLDRAGKPFWVVDGQLLRESNGGDSGHCRLPAHAPRTNFVAALGSHMVTLTVAMGMFRGSTTRRTDS